MCLNQNHPTEDVVPDQENDRTAPELRPSTSLLEDLVSANHILFDQGVLDAFGHVSVRHDRRPDHFLLARNMAPGRVMATDIIEFNRDSQPVNAKGRKVYLERFIHGEIYRRRPDVVAIVHSHSPSIIPLSVSASTQLRALFHMAGFIGKASPVFEIREVGGDSTDLLIRDNALGEALAKKFDASEIVLMRGHGSTVVGYSLQQVVYRAVYAELNARYQLEAMRLGDVTYLTEGEIESTSEVIEAQAQRPWDLWVEQARARRRK